MEHQEQISQDLNQIIQSKFKYKKKFLQIQLPEDSQNSIDSGKFNDEIIINQCVEFSENVSLKDSPELSLNQDLNDSKINHSKNRNVYKYSQKLNDDNILDNYDYLDQQINLNNEIEQLQQKDDIENINIIWDENNQLQYNQLQNDQLKHHQKQQDSQQQCQNLINNSIIQQQLQQQNNQNQTQSSTENESSQLLQKQKNQNKMNIDKRKMQNKVLQVIDDEVDLGEVGEWEYKRADESSDEDSNSNDFVKAYNNEQSSIKNEQELQNNQQKQLVLQKLEFGFNQQKKNQKNGLFANSLKDKAISIQLAKGVQLEQNDIIIPADNLQIDLQQEQKTEYKNKNDRLDDDDDDWDQISKINIQKIQETQQEQQLVMIQKEEIILMIKQLDINKYKNNIWTVDSSADSIWLKCLKLFLPNFNQINENLKIERDQVFSSTQIEFDNQSQFHLRMLHTLNATLLEQKQFQRYGEHWKQIGFQGRDPATDFRGVGILGLYQFVQFCLEDIRLIKKILKQNKFPLAISLLNFTAISLKLLRQGKLNSLIKKKGQVIDVFNLIYKAIALEFFQIYEEYKFQAKDFGIIKHNIIANVSIKPLDFIKNYEQYFTQLE